FDGEQGETVREDEIPAELKDDAELARQEMLDKLSMFSDELMELMLEEEEVPVDLINKIIRQATLNQEITPVMMGSAYRNKGVQPLLDAVNLYLPSPLDREVFATDLDHEGQKAKLTCDPKAPVVGMAF